ncbi:MAG: hypothetical protein ACI4HQ_07690 [Acetatifactor sp.]
MVFIVFFLGLTACILAGSELSLYYARLGLHLWFEKMVPSLLPFMILSGCMVRMQLTDKISMLLSPVISPLWKVRKKAVYCMTLGFLCGFPMGARVTAELYERGELSRREADYLLAFCNNIGPVYFCSFVLPLLGRQLIAPYLFGMYGIPLLYGLFLRNTLFRDLESPQRGKNLEKGPAPVGCFQALEASVSSSAKSMLSLGGYMILFNLLNILPHTLLGRKPVVLAPLLEITGGLSILEGSLPLYSLLALAFGGLSCMAQTFSCIADTDLSINGYIVHKILLTILTALYYLAWFLLWPESFLG